MDLWVLIVGLVMLAVALPVAGRRVVFLYRLITSGKPAPDRVENVTSKIGQAEQSIAAIKARALAEVETVAEETATEIVSALTGVTVNKADAEQAVKASKA